MAKLNKQEVNAIAGKLHRELEKAAEESRRNAISNYVPSENYKTVKNLLLKRDELINLIDGLKKQEEEILEQIENILRKNYDCWWSSEKPIDCICSKIVETECKLRQVPSVDELKEDVTIAAIDDSFDTSAFIEEQLSKFK